MNLSNFSLADFALTVSLLSLGLSIWVLILSRRYK